MARIPDDEIQRLKSEISVERLVTSFGVELKRHGAELIGRCPFHDDKTPSLVVIAEDEPVALPGQMQCRRLDHRLGDEDAGRELPARG